MKNRIMIIFGLVVFFFANYPLNLAAGESIHPIKIKSYRGISYMSGGIGLDEREFLMKTARTYRLKLMFAVKGGSYLADVKVNIKDSSGKTIFKAVSEGPWFYADLQPGKYIISVTAMSNTLQKKAQIKHENQIELRFFWQE